MATTTKKTSKIEKRNLWTGQKAIFGTQRNEKIRAFFEDI